MNMQALSEKRMCFKYVGNGYEEFATVWKEWGGVNLDLLVSAHEPHFASPHFTLSYVPSNARCRTCQVTAFVPPYGKNLTKISEITVNFEKI